jgi:hypothetical protein
VQATALELLEYCRANNWAGHDPYDALNSRVFEALPFLDFKLARLALTQLVKRSPINLRTLLRVPKTKNAKALALFVTGILKLAKLGLADRSFAFDLIADLQAMRSPRSDYWSWGYSFPWQGRIVFVPRGCANLICTTFVANAFLDAYETVGDENYLQIAQSAAHYLIDELLWTDGSATTSFAYPDRSTPSRVHNANFLGSALLCRVYAHSREPELVDKALKVARYSAGQQREDGSWPYGELTSQRWIDNFHTGFNLCALRRVGELAETGEFEMAVRSGFDFYRNQFFEDGCVPKYFHDRTYPIDVHCVAQSIITLVDLADRDDSSIELAYSVYNWAMANLWDPRGYFNYQKRAWGKVKTPYMRWGQAWMLSALSTLLNADSY